MRDILIVTAIWNLIVFAVYGVDKWKAIHNEWRISELTLIMCCFLMGGAGGLCGMYVWRHKTRHLKFRILVPLALVCNAAALAAMKLYVL